MDEQRLLAEQGQDAEVAAVMSARGTLADMHRRFRLANPYPVYPCPYCRTRLTKKPVCVLGMRELVLKISDVLGEKQAAWSVSPTDAVDDSDWAHYFKQDRL